MIDRVRHEELMRDILTHLNRQKENPFVLKGGTSLMFCYNLDRFSEDLDFDALPLKRPEFFEEQIVSYCEAEKIPYRIGKITDTSRKVFVHYSEESKPLKIELSLRRKRIPADSYQVKNGILVYSIDEICRQKCSAYSSRDKIRDLYDVTFICTEYYDSLDQSAKDALLNAFEYKDLDQFDYVVNNADDPLIDKDKLETRFLESFEKVGLMTPSPVDLFPEIDSFTQLDMTEQQQRGFDPAIYRSVLVCEQLDDDVAICKTADGWVLSPGWLLQTPDSFLNAYIALFDAIGTQGMLISDPSDPKTGILPGTLKNRLGDDFEPELPTQRKPVTASQIINPVVRAQEQAR